MEDKIMARLQKGPQRAISAILATGLLSACAATVSEDIASAAPGPVEMGGTCNAEPAQYHVGHAATQAMGAAILKDSGARTLRWGPPRAAWTMDYRSDRVNVRYDDAMKIVDVTCG
jgi:hypothetical protein